jgi:hypothetical protein
MDPIPTPPSEWAERERHWRRRLGRLKLGVEPIEEQLERYRRVTWALTVIPGAIAMLFLSLFWAFGAPLLGLAVSGVVLGPIIAFAWLDFLRLRRRANRYLRERRAHEAQQGPIDRTPDDA